MIQTESSTAEPTPGNAVPRPGPVPKTKSQLAAAARPAFKAVAHELCESVRCELGLPEIRAFRPGKSLSELAVWFESAPKLESAQGALIVAVGPQELVASMDNVLAYALAWQGPRILSIICSESQAARITPKVPWIDRDITVFATDGDRQPKYIPTLSRGQTIETAASASRPVRSLDDHLLGIHEGAVASLTASLDGNLDLARADRSSYRAWCCAGQRVLVMRRSTDAICITAGVDFKGAIPPGEQQARVFEVSSHIPLTSSDEHDLENRVEHAIKRRLSDDGSYLEHRMQASLAKEGLEAELGMVAFKREYPAWRGEDGSGLLDFLGLDRNNHLHVIETKANPNDVAIVLQALDYGVWVMANQVEIRKDLGWESPDEDGCVVLDFVCAPGVKKDKSGRFAPDGMAIGPYMVSQLEALSPTFEWRISLVEDPLAHPCRPSEPVSRKLMDNPRLVARQIRG